MLQDQSGIREHSCRGGEERPGRIEQFGQEQLSHIQLGKPESMQLV